jgi:hypothetical protein
MPRADNVAVLLVGWGVKEGSRVKPWKRRYCVLRSATEVETTAYRCTHMFVYYKSDKQVKSG